MLPCSFYFHYPYHYYYCNYYSPYHPVPVFDPPPRLVSLDQEVPGEEVPLHPLLHPPHPRDHDPHGTIGQ